jgi:membrane-bound ClpP family serine protease
MESLLLWGLCLLAAALLLIVVEVFVPSGGVVSLIADVVAVAGVVCLFRVSVVWGFAGILSLIILGPLVGIFALHILPSTPMGRRLIHGSEAPEAEENGGGGAAPPGAPDPLESLIGREGVALSDLRLGGTIRVEGHKRQAMSETTFIPVGSRVRVTGVDGGVLRVRPIK